STRALHDELHPRGVRYLDAGISGGAAGAEKGTLTLMVGGDETALAQVKPLLDTFSAHVHHMGRSGAGHVTKVLNNFLNGVTLTGPAALTAFQVSNALGYGDQISNRVVDALGDLAGGVRVSEQDTEQDSEQEER